MLGYRKSKIVWLLTAENILICGLALCCGILLGAVFHKGIVADITWALGLSVDAASMPLFNKGAISYAAIFVLAVIIALLFSNMLTVRKATLIGLVRFDRKAEKIVKPNAVSALFGLLCILAGYCFAADILRGRSSFWHAVGFSPIALLVLCLVSVGTVLFIRSFLPWFWNRAKARKRSFYRPVKIINTPGFIYRIRTNTKTFIMLAFLMAGTLIITGALALTLYYPIAAISRIIPSEIEFRAEDEEMADMAAQIVNEKAGNATVASTALINATSPSEKLPYEYSIGTQKGDAANERIIRNPAFECIGVTAYSTLLNQQGRIEEVDSLLPLGDGECILVKYQPNQDGSTEDGYIYVLNADTPLSLTVKCSTLLNPIGFANSVATLVVPDSVYDELLRSDLPTTEVISINGTDKTEIQNIYDELSALTNGSPYLVCSSIRTDEIIHDNSSTFLLLGFLVVLFFIASGSILFFNNISAVTEAKSEYTILARMGYSRKLIKTVLSKQISVFYAIPLFIGLLHSAFAILCYKVALVQSILGNSLTVYLPVAFAYLLTFAIFGIYYLLTIRACKKIVFS
jgi:putative ABC transport system permease protein